MKFSLIVLVALVLLNSCETIRISPIKSSGTDIKVQRGIQSLIAEGETVSVIVNGGTRGNETMFSISIINKSDEAVYFDENTMVSFQIGDYNKSHWESGNIFTATDYYRKAEKDATTSEILMAVAVGLSAANAGRSTSTYSGSVYGSTTTGSSYYGSYSGQIQTYDSSKAQQEIAQAQNNMYRMMESNRNYLENLSKTLLYSSEIPAKSIYSGFVFAPLQKTPDMKLLVEMNNETFEFVFRRSDYQEILTPFIAYQRTKGYAGYLFSPNAPYGFSIGWLSDTWSMYLDTSFQFPAFEGYDTLSIYKYYDNGDVDDDFWNWVYQNKTTTLIYDGVLGVQYSILPYLWIDGGLGIHYQEDYRLYDKRSSYSGNSYGIEWIGSQEENINLVIQGGLISGLGPLYLTGKYRYILNNGSSFGIGLGFTW